MRRITMQRRIGLAVDHARLPRRGDPPCSDIGLGDASKQHVSALWKRRRAARNRNSIGCGELREHLRARSSSIFGVGRHHSTRGEERLPSRQRGLAEAYKAGKISTTQDDVVKPTLKSTSGTISSSPASDGKCPIPPSNSGSRMLPRRLGIIGFRGIARNQMFDDHCSCYGARLQFAFTQSTGSSKPGLSPLWRPYWCDLSS